MSKKAVRNTILSVITLLIFIFLWIFIPKYLVGLDLHAVCNAYKKHMTKFREYYRDDAKSKNDIAEVAHDMAAEIEKNISTKAVKNCFKTVTDSDLAETHNIWKKCAVESGYTSWDCEDIEDYVKISEIYKSKK